MYFDKKNTMTAKTFDTTRTIETGFYETANKVGHCLWIDDKMCIDLDTLKVIYKAK